MSSSGRSRSGKRGRGVPLEDALADVSGSNPGGGLRDGMLSEDLDASVFPVIDGGISIFQVRGLKGDTIPRSRRYFMHDLRFEGSLTQALFTCQLMCSIPVIFSKKLRSEDKPRKQTRFDYFRIGAA